MYQRIGQSAANDPDSRRGHLGILLRLNTQLDGSRLIPHQGNTDIPYLLLRWPANAAALIPSAWHMPGIEIAQHNILTYLLPTVALGLISTRIRANILLFTRQYAIAGPSS